MTTEDELLRRRVQKVHARLTHEYDGPRVGGAKAPPGAWVPRDLSASPSGRAAVVARGSALRVLRLSRSARGAGAAIQKVDADHFRVAMRLGLIERDVAPPAAGPALAAQLPTAWPAEQVYEHHELMALHGQQTCFYAAPACNRCAVLDQCPFGKARLGQVDERIERLETALPRYEGRSAAH